MARRIIGWRMVRPRRRLRGMGGLGMRVMFEAPPRANGNGGGTVYAQPYPYTWSCAPGMAPGKFPGSCIVIPLPGGATVTLPAPGSGGSYPGTPATFPSAGGAPVTLPVQTQPAVSADTVERFKAWLQEQSIVSGYENWKVVGAGVAAWMLLRPKGR